MRAPGALCMQWCMPESFCMSDMTVRCLALQSRTDSRALAPNSGCRTTRCRLRRRAAPCQAGNSRFTQKVGSRMLDSCSFVTLTHCHSTLHCFVLKGPEQDRCFSPSRQRPLAMWAWRGVHDFGRFAQRGIWSRQSRQRCVACSSGRGHTHTHTQFPHTRTCSPSHAAASTRHGSHGGATGGRRAPGRTPDCG